MRCRSYGAKRAPKGASSAGFRLLSPEEQIERVRKLKLSKLSDDAIAQLTGLGRQEIWQMLEGKR